jgi:hypothetical protein
MKRVVIATIACILSIGGLSAGTANAFGTRTFNCDGYAEGVSTWTPDYHADTYAGYCPTVRVRQRNSGGTYGSWSYGYAGYIYVALSGSAIGASHQAFNSMDQWVGTTT